MKNLKVMFFITVFLGSMLAVSAQKKVVKIYPKQGVVVTKLHKPVKVVHKGTNFYFSDGVWYHTVGRKYAVCAAPVGIRVRHLPRGRKIVFHNGQKLYLYKNVWYQKNGKDYVVVII